jgi:hypothetical protein
MGNLVAIGAKRHHHFDFRNMEKHDCPFVSVEDDKISIGCFESVADFATTQ